MRFASHALPLHSAFCIQKTQHSTHMLIFMQGGKLENCCWKTLFAVNQINYKLKTFVKQVTACSIPEVTESVSLWMLSRAVIRPFAPSPTGTRPLMLVSCVSLLPTWLCPSPPWLWPMSPLPWLCPCPCPCWWNMASPMTFTNKPAPPTISTNVGLWIVSTSMSRLRGLDKNRETKSNQEHCVD